ncbi:hypothetical protein GCM10027578_06510 [Spirosoma luteolum]
MTTEDIYIILTDAISSVIPDEWTIARLNVQFLDGGQDIEFDGTYLTPDGEPEIMPTEFPDEVIGAVRALYLLHSQSGAPAANQLQFDLASTGQFTADFSWDQEMQDEDEHFSKGGTVSEWITIRNAKYGERDTSATD